LKSKENGIRELREKVTRLEGKVLRDENGQEIKLGYEGYKTLLVKSLEYDKVKDKLCQLEGPGKSERELDTVKNEVLVCFFWLTSVAESEIERKRSGDLETRAKADLFTVRAEIQRVHDGPNLERPANDEPRLEPRVHGLQDKDPGAKFCLGRAKQDSIRRQEDQPDPRDFKSNSPQI
jgi:hypothetical protein